MKEPAGVLRMWSSQSNKLCLLNIEGFLESVMMRYWHQHYLARVDIEFERKKNFQNVVIQYSKQHSLAVILLQPIDS